MDLLRIATRRSNLAMRQSGLVAEMIRRRCPGVAVELVAMTTRGDTHRGPLTEVGGKGVFTRELEDALRDGRVDLAVHSAKDMPAAMAEEFRIAAVPPRGDPRDALVSRCGDLRELPGAAVIGTGSPRRGAQLLSLRPDLRIVPVRGNVETRVNKAIGPDASLHAVVLAMAGLERSGQAEAVGGHIHPFSAEDVVPAGGQGILAIQALAGNARAVELAGRVDDLPSRQALESERVFLRELEADCHSCVAVHVAPGPDGRWLGRAMVARPNGSDRLRHVCVAATARDAVAALLHDLTARGARQLLAEGGPTEA
ncbi:MAG TPA: hydroxymethylbilane synthase [Phycisphaerae bacterium]|nr:hydroxymethylbilane synthase [Phycisphaerae bacterium]